MASASSSGPKVGRPRSSTVVFKVVPIHAIPGQPSSSQGVQAALGRPRSSQVAVVSWTKLLQTVYLCTSLEINRIEQFNASLLPKTLDLLTFIGNSLNESISRKVKSNREIATKSLK